MSTSPFYCMFPFEEQITPALEAFAASVGCAVDVSRIGNLMWRVHSPLSDERQVLSLQVNAIMWQAKWDILVIQTRVVYTDHQTQLTGMIVPGKKVPLNPDGVLQINPFLELLPQAWDELLNAPADSIRMKESAVGYSPASAT